MIDAEEALPPRSQVDYSMKEHEGVVQIPFYTAYASVLKKKPHQCAPMGPGSFHRCFKALITSGQVDKDSLEHLLSDGLPLALPVMGISEPLRFPRYKEWLMNVLVSASASNEDQLGHNPLDIIFDEMVPLEYSEDFNNWGSISDCMYTQTGFKELTFKETANMIGIIKRSTVLPLPKPEPQYHKNRSSSSSHVKRK
ncbi:hypothetical protein E2562_032099 [Oryza meyeriana var. granulata]|uniref:Uncharacterized protein n=1 Tax=Oryza meyeriana var. granulata TaxID=110450 RepID=A0A6G1CK01_9ORYZ|nr:hypothetical protein E2562_032099 [Oryza meyeriana var. granulata]